MAGRRAVDAEGGFSAAVGRRPGKPVLMSAKGGVHALLGFDVQANRVVLPAGPEAG